MTDTIDWAEFASPSDYPDEFKFETPGDSIVGLILKVEAVDTRYGRKPVLRVRTDDNAERTVWASNVDLQARLADLRPAGGDRIAIVYTGLGEAKPGQNAPKLYDVQLVKGTAPAAAPQAQPAPAAAPTAAGLLGEGAAPQAAPAAPAPAAPPTASGLL